MDQMGSPYLLAHGLGVPVKDASTAVKFPAAGAYRVWVRTRDWVAPWNAPGRRGSFRCSSTASRWGRRSAPKGAEWHWQDGGIVEVRRRTASRAARPHRASRDAATRSSSPSDLEFMPPNDGAGAGRRSAATLWVLDGSRRIGGAFDLVVVGGGIAGTSARSPAARQWADGRADAGSPGARRQRQLRGARLAGGAYATGAVSAHRRHRRGDWSATRDPATATRRAHVYEDRRKLDLVRAEPRITLLLGTARQRRGDASTGRSLGDRPAHSARRAHPRIDGPFFADCTGDGAVGFLVGGGLRDVARGAHGREQPLERAGRRAGTSANCSASARTRTRCRSRSSPRATPQPFPRCPWAIDLTDKPFPGRTKLAGEYSDAEESAQPPRRLVLGERASTRIRSTTSSDTRPQPARDVRRVGRAEERGRPLSEPSAGVGGVHRGQARVAPAARRRDPHGR